MLLGVTAKVLATVLVVMAALVVAARAGPFWGGLVGSLPISAGPAYVLLALDHAPPFLAQSALSSLVANAASLVFLGVLARMTGRPFAQLLGTAVALWVAVVAIAAAIPWNVPGAIAFNLLCFAVGSWGRGDGGAPPTRTGARGPTDDRLYIRSAWRALTIGLLAGGVASFAALLGPGLTGAALMFPLNLAAIAVIAYVDGGLGRMRAIAAAARVGMIGFGLALLVLNQSVQAMPVPGALALALGVAMAWPALAGLVLQSASVRPRGAAR